MIPFGSLTDGRVVHALTIGSDNLTVRILTYGAVLHDVRLRGVDRNLTLNADNLADYDGPARFFGALVGPVVNRMGGASADIGGVTHQFEANQDGKHILHSGRSGTQFKVWDVVDHGRAHVTFGLTLPDGEGGFPGNRQIRATFTVAGATLRMAVTGTTDRATILNFANHSYWNLDGGPTWQGHTLRVAADAYLPVGDGVIPTGEVRDVTGTGYDLRAGRVLTPGEPSIDHNFCLSSQPQPLRDVLWLTGASGVGLTLATTEPGVQIYDGGHTKRPGHGVHEGLAIEAQGWPDAPHHSHFPQIGLSPDQTYQQITEWRFLADVAR